MIKFALWLILPVLLVNSNLFAQWSTVAQLTPSELGSYPSVSVPNCSTVVIAGGSNNVPKIFMTTNSGLNFTDITGNITTNELYCIYALNSDTIFAGDGGSPGGSGGNARVYKTVNGGLNWSVMLSTGGNNGFISGIKFSKTNPEFGIIASDPATTTDSFWIAKTHDRGKTWQLTEAPQTAPYITQNSLFVVDSLFYGFGLITTPPKIYMTTNGGVTWSVKTIGLTGTSVPSIAFQNDKLNAIALSDAVAPNIARTTNGGLNWETINNGANLTYAGIVKWIPGTEIYFMASGFMKRTSNNGSTWESMETGEVVNFRQMDIYRSSANSICAYALAVNGKIIRFEGEPFGIDPENTNVPVKYALEQNYPNPFNPVTTIKYSVPSAGNIKLAVFDLNGRLIKELVNSHHHTGNYIESVDMSAYASGIYIYELSSEDVSISKKMALIK